MPMKFADRVQEEILNRGPLEAYKHLVAENDSQIRKATLGNGRDIATQRTLIHTGAVAHWAEKCRREFGYDRPFAVAALGGTGRSEMAPHSDTDFALLFDDSIDDNAFREELARQTMSSREFQTEYGFAFQPQPFNLDDMPKLEGKQLNAFVDFLPIYDPDQLGSRFLERIRATYDPFEHFLHVSSFWREHWGTTSSDAERLDAFDIKTAGLRVFQAGVWTLAGKDFVHSHEIYKSLPRRDLEAYEFLMRIRAFVHLRRSGPGQPAPGGVHPEDVLSFDDFTAFGEMLGPAAARDVFEFAGQVREKLLTARRRVERFTRGVVGQELKSGRRVSAQSTILYGVGGLRQTLQPSEQDPVARSRAALSLLVASQHYGVKIDPAELESTFRDAGDWLVPVPEVSFLFYEAQGSLADSFEFLAQLDGAEERLFPGHSKFEASIDDRVLSERNLMRGALVRRKIRALEEMHRQGRELQHDPLSAAKFTELSEQVTAPVEAAQLDANHLAAVKLALKTKRLPVTPDDERRRADQSLALHERFASGFSGLPLDHYFDQTLRGCQFSPEALRVAKYLVANRRAFKDWTTSSLPDAQHVSAFAEHCQDEPLLRTLFVFTCADRADWDSQQHNPTRWFNFRELYFKTRQHFSPKLEPLHLLRSAGYSPEELAVLRDFGDDFFSGIYRHHANRFGSHLVRMAEGQATEPKASILREGGSTILAVAAADYPGLAASITGAFWRDGFGVQQAHLFSSRRYRLALDFFHLAPNRSAAGPQLARAVEDAIRQQRYTQAGDEATLPPLSGHATLEEWRPGLYRLRCETANDVSAALFFLTCKIFLHLRGNIFGLAAHAGRGCSYVTIYHSLPADLPLLEAQKIVASWL